MNFFAFILIVSAIAGCRTIPPGPAPEGPIVAPPVKDSNSGMDADAAVNYMLVSLVMKCRPIADAGINKPKVQNDFMFSSKQVDYLQMDLWRKLIKMKMITPVVDTEQAPEYKLISTITPVGEESLDGRSYLWKISLEQVSDKKNVWKEEVLFQK